jgi:nitrite reductase (NADH) large subunit
MRMVIIGNSAAGTAAIEAIRQHDRQSRIVQLSDESVPLYSRCLLPYYMAGTIKKELLGYRDSNFHQEMNVELLAGAGFRATRLDVRQKKVECDNGTGIEFDRLLICTGASAKLPSNLPKAIQGIHTLRNFEDAEKIRTEAKSAGSAVVLGAGLIGIKAATALNAGGIKTTVVARSNRVLSQMIDDDASWIIRRQLQEKSITFLPETDVSEVHSAGKRLAAVRTSDGRTIECQLLIVAKGTSPNTAWTDLTAIADGRGIKTNPHMRTDHEGIFAAGDVSEAYDLVLEDYAPNALWTCAVEQGRVAGLNMAGKSTPYNGAIGMNSLNVCDVSLIAFGITTPLEASGCRVLTFRASSKNVYRKIVIGRDHRIKGIILVGKIENAGVLLSLIQERADVSPFEEELVSERFNVGKLLRHFEASSLKALEFKRKTG